MDLVGSFIRHVTYPLWVRKNGSATLRYLREFEHAQFASAEQVRRRQWDDFQALLKHAFDRCPFYRDKYAAAGIRPEDVRCLEDVKNLPTVSKSEVQEHLEEMIDRSWPRSPIRDMTGGSTGRPMVFYYDKRIMDRRAAATIRHNRWAGWDIGDRVAVLWGARRDLGHQGWNGRAIRQRLLHRKRLLDASALDEQAMRAFAIELLRFRPAVIQGYANTLGLFARFLRAEGTPPIRLRGIVSSAEVLTTENRALIEEVFSCRVFDRYGSRELGIIASECEGHRGMHVNAENLLVEVLAGEVPRLGEDGEVVVTSLHNYLMPMIRYRTMDAGCLEASPCLCGRGLPLLSLKGGRVTDFLVSASGQKVSGIVLATYVITNIPGIGQVQFHQRRVGHVAVHVVVGPGWSERAGVELAEKVQGFLGRETEVEIVFHPNIPCEASGKYTFSRSTISGAQ